jgi:hypothetical protein
MRLYLPSVFFLFFASLHLMAVRATADVIDQITISPAHPTQYDPIEITVSGTAPHSCFDAGRSVTMGAVGISLETGGCPFDPVPPGATPYAVTFVIGPLAPADYGVHVLVEDASRNFNLVVESSAPFPPTVLRLVDNRFHVDAVWTLASGATGKAQPVRFTDQAGYFWFFDAANAEVAVKFVDGRSVNGHFWVFSGGLSNVGYTLTVTDTLTGKTKSYVNPQGTQTGVSDTATF